jgi:hypothetical protein
MLCQLRLLVYLECFDGRVKEKSWHNYFRCFTAALLYGSGGHSIHEFLVPFQLQEVQLRLRLPNVSAVSLFYHQNEKAMARALSFVRTYNRKIIRLKRVVGFSVARMLPFVRSKLGEAQRQKEAEKARALELAERERAQKRFAFSVDRALGLAANKAAAIQLRLKTLNSFLQGRGWLVGLEAGAYPALNARLAATNILAADAARRQALIEALSLTESNVRDLLEKCLSKQ